MFNSQKPKKNTDLSCFITDFTAEKPANVGVFAYDVIMVIDELQHLILSKCFLALYLKLIYEIAIFHSITMITGETCDKCHLRLGSL